MVRPDLCQTKCKVNPVEFLGKFWLDSLVHNEKMLRFIVDLVGSKRVMVGSDYPFPLGEQVTTSPGALVDKTYSDKDPTELKIKQDIFQNSALEFLGVKKERFL